MGTDATRDPLSASPWWAGPAQAVIQRLPAGRFRAASAIARLRPQPFVARLPAHLGGARFWCDLGDEIARDAGLTGSYEPQISWLLARILAPGMVFVDAGANWGYFSLLAAPRVGPSGAVLAIEADPRIFARLDANLRLNAWPQLRARPLAVSSADGIVVLEGYVEGSSNRGVSRIRPEGVAGDGLFQVRAVAIDALLATEGLPFVDAIKIDVEGAEADVLAGMRDGIRAHRYARVFIELHPTLLAERGMTPDSCCAPLRDAGYRGWTFDHTPAARRRAAYAAPRAVADILAPSDRVPSGDPWPHMLWTAPGADPC
jgi:FkbM family methyltransferase